MSHSHSSEESWSDTESEASDELEAPLRSYAYQIEMFEHSMQGNIIAVMGTGTGKTQVAKLRIEAELERSVGKLVWFTAPSVVLAYQQHLFLSKQLPAFKFRLITGMDNAEHWKTEDIWNKVLFKIDVVVSTPQILLDALDFGFLSLHALSLLVIDEAHHCIGDSPLKRVMQRHYHGSEDSLPHILGLSASPITKRSVSEMSILETNLKAKCKMPTQQVEEYSALIKMPELETIMFAENQPRATELMILLQSAISTVSLDSDPYYREIRSKKDPRSLEKMKKMIQRNATPAITELRAFARSCADVQLSLGCWACDVYITSCVRKVLNSASLEKSLNTSQDSLNGTTQLIGSVLQPFGDISDLRHSGILMEDSLSPKVEALFGYLAKEYRKTLRGLVFVEKRDTAWAVAELISHHPSMQMYQAFSFVGVSNPSYKGPFDFAELPVQSKNLERFRRGELNLCIATSVLEEGIDIPAMNLVISFDERKNLRSFVQSRGRARAAESKYVIFRPLQETNTKIKVWNDLERAMNQQCEDSAEALAELQAAEMVEEFSSEIFRVSSTGATLTFDNAPQRLQHFCAKLPKKEGLSVPELAYCIDGEVGGPIRAKVYLPSSLAPDLQLFHSESTWCTQKMAKRDAAYQAYLALYRAGLVTKHLLPLETPKHEASKDHTATTDAVPDALCVVEAQWDPWPQITEHWSSSTQMFAHRLHLEDSGDTYPRMLILLPTKLASMSFPLYITANGTVQVSIGEGEVMSGIPFTLAQDISFYLLTSVLQRRLEGITKGQLPLLLVPDIGIDSLERWYRETSRSIPLLDLLAEGGQVGERYLIRVRGHLSPLILAPEGVPSSVELFDDSESMTITATKITKRLEYLLPLTHTNLRKPLQPKRLLVQDCEVLRLHPAYGDMLLLTPSITHMLETALRSSEACRGPLSCLQVTNLDLVTEALTLPVVSARNYQRLEFLGDDLLKFHASLQLYVDAPMHPESLLTADRGRLVSNSRLQRTTRELGLDQYITRGRFSAARWKAGVQLPNNQRSISSKKRLSRKTLADVIEALIGAAHCDGIATGTSETKVISALQLFLSEVQWRSVSENLARLEAKDDSSLFGSDALDHVQSLMGYEFAHRSLLGEALTHSSLRPGVLSYERLEFLGDAIMDHIVKIKLFNSPLRLDPEAMTLRRHALVSNATLAFFALQASHERQTVGIHTDARTRETTTREVFEPRHLPDYLRRISQDMDQREATLKAYDEVRESILISFKDGTKFPWRELTHLRAPKSYSDVVESVLGAVFVDSKGDLACCESVLGEFGFLTLLDRFALEPGLDLIHPEEQLAKVIQGCKLITSETRSGWRCKVMVGDERIARARKASCAEEARCRAAQRAVDVLLMKETVKGLEVTTVIEEKPGSVVSTEKENERENENNETDGDDAYEEDEGGEETDNDTEGEIPDDVDDLYMTDDYED
ncbi:hypothetical protein PV08_06809 [Exophiala spinifera]|uniref:Dicer-like protein 2 n=1 Tax=Exophiala spinifera TaxID=91928 RepID=A0A0D2B577_9EURO|nr:uncharacterized protein PV08_06809 [Exophiala spinifera]KIW14028.1 hypothetical protein PV08_06809 [Exophiala spinifera]